jgi:hypothetical protein
MIVFYLGITILIFGTFLSFFFKKNIKLIVFSAFLILTSLIFLVFSIYYLVNKDFSNFDYIVVNLLNKQISLEKNSQINSGNLDQFSILSNLNFKITRIGLFFIFILSIIGDPLESTCRHASLALAVVLHVVTGKPWRYPT